MIEYTVMNDETEKNRIVFEELPVPKAMAQMAVPMIISQLIVLIYNIGDTFFLGRTGNPYMVAGAALILPVYNLSIMFANISGTGGGTLIARLLGAGRENDAAKVSSFSFWFALISAFTFAICIMFFMDPLLRLLGASGNTMDYARQYATCVVVIGGVPTILSMTLGNLIRNAGRAKEAGIGMSLGGIINIALDPLFMFVILPKGNEVLGAGMATAISNFVACIYFLVLSRRMNSGIINFSHKTETPGKEELKSFFVVGIPAALGPFLFDIDYILLDRLASGYSDIALAAIGIVLKAERFPLNIGVGLCLGMVPLAAYNYSAGNITRMEEIVRFTRTTGVIVSVASIILYEIFAPQIMSFFISDAETVEIGSGFLRARALATVMMFLCFSLLNFFQAVGKGGTAMFLVVLRWAVVNIPMLFILNRIFGMYGIVWSQLVSDSLVALVSYIIYVRFRKKLDTEKLPGAC